MTTNKPAARKPITCSDCHVQLNSSNTRHHRQHDLCDACYELAGLENEHQDGMHEDEAVADCLMCDPNARKDRSRKARPSTIPGPMQSHAACYAAGTHEATKAGRAACRKGRNA